MITEERMKLEEAVLLQHMPKEAFKFAGIGTNDPIVVMAALSNSKRKYVLVVKLARFPEEIPVVYVNETLYDCNDNPLLSPSADMHTLDGSNDGKTHICHYGHQAWNAGVSLYKIYLKCRLWIECYELHLQTGNDIDYYLSHQS